MRKLSCKSEIIFLMHVSNKKPFTGLFILFSSIENYFAFPRILNILVPHFTHTPVTAFIPFFMVTSFSFFISLGPLHFMHRAVVAICLIIVIAHIVPQTYKKTIYFDSMKIYERCSSLTYLIRTKMFSRPFPSHKNTRLSGHFPY